MLVAVAGLLLGCGSQSENFDDRDWTKENGLQTAPYREVESLFAGDQSDADQFRFALNGVRHDLTMGADAAPDTRCTCLDVAIGPSTDPRFVWAGKRPRVSGKDLVVAVRTDGAKCPGGPDKRRPSIQAVETRGDDVTIVIEELSFDRPEAMGAIIVKPGQNGRLYVRGAKSRAPRTDLTDDKPIYAATVAGTNICRVQTDLRQHHQQVRAGRRF